MTFNLNSLLLGQKVWGVVKEISIDGSLIVMFSGNLLRIENKSSRSFRPDQRIQLIVDSLRPVSFRVVESQRIDFGKTKIDVEA